MRCPYCGNDDDKVIDTRTLAEGDSIRRRRECVNCGARFTSYEKIEDKPLMVIKQDGRREPFDRQKVVRGIERALEKRPVSQMDSENLVNEIENQSAKKGKTTREISSSDIGELVLKNLYLIDKVAYIRFASVYRHFENPDEFVEEIRKMEGSFDSENS